MSMEKTRRADLMLDYERVKIVTFYAAELTALGGGER